MRPLICLSSITFSRKCFLNHRIEKYFPNTPCKITLITVPSDINVAEILIISPTYPILPTYMGSTALVLTNSFSPFPDNFYAKLSKSSLAKSQLQLVVKYFKLVCLPLWSYTGCSLNIVFFP